MQKGKLIHCNEIISCEEPKEEGQIGYREENGIDIQSFRNIFLKDFRLDYILDYCLSHGIHFHIATHSQPTSTCQEKAEITGLPLERVIKGVYLEDSETEDMYGLFIPGTKHSNDLRLNLANYLGINISEIVNDNRIKKARKEFLDTLGVGIEFGTVHPFVNQQSFLPNGKLGLILFDQNFLERRGMVGGLDDFSFTAHESTGYDNHRLSIQMNYSHAYRILSSTFPGRVRMAELV